MQDSMATKVRKLGVALALVGLFGGATASPALANHNNGNGQKVGHDNGKGNAKGHSKQDPATPQIGDQAGCLAAGLPWASTTVVDNFGNIVGTLEWCDLNGNGAYDDA